MTTHSFILKVWVERGAASAAPTWRGHITHVPGGERIYLRDLDAIAAFVAPYLARMGVAVGGTQAEGGDDAAQSAG